LPYALFFISCLFFVYFIHISPYGADIADFCTLAFAGSLVT